jgi:hypothetical protein
MEAQGEYSSYSFMTSALDWAEWSASRPGRALHPGIGPPVPTGQVGLNSWPGHRRQRKNSLASVGHRTSIAQSVARHYTD